MPIDECAIPNCDFWAKKASLVILEDYLIASNGNFAYSHTPTNKNELRRQSTKRSEHTCYCTRRYLKSGSMFPCRTRWTSFDQQLILQGCFHAASVLTLTAGPFSLERSGCLRKIVFRSGTLVDDDKLNHVRNTLRVAVTEMSIFKVSNECMLFF